MTTTRRPSSRRSIGNGPVGRRRKEGAVDKADSEAHPPTGNDGPAVDEAHDPTPKSPTARSPEHDARQRRVKVRAGVAAVVTSALAIWLATWFVFLAGPRTANAPSPSPTPSTAAIINPGHLPGRFDVSTMTPRHPFYAIPNFYDFSSCGRPCWLPLYQEPTEQSAFVTDGWPCEYYGPNYSSEPSCVQPSTRRTASEMADPKVKSSGDKILVVCQLRQLGNGQPAPSIRNQIGQSSNIWDMVAVPVAFISQDSPAVSQLIPVPHMPGFDEAFAPDIWLGNTGWHDIPCK